MYILVVGHISISGNDLLEPVRHAVDQILQVLQVVHLEDPQLPDLLLQFLQVGGVGLLQLQLHPRPHIFNGVEIRTVPRPFDELDVWPLLEPV